MSVVEVVVAVASEVSALAIVLTTASVVLAACDVVA
jgi:hypothetical protein